MKVLLILVDGMRPDAMVKNQKAQEIMKRSVYTLEARTVFPSVTLPCHMSLFHSVDPARHGILSNTYMPQVRPINGLFDVLSVAGKTSGFFYNWEQLRDLSRPGAVTFSRFYKGKTLGYDVTNDMLTDDAISILNQHGVDFAFLYMAYLDESGHKHGWLSDEYMDALENSWANITRVIKEIPEDYQVIITADHGGHDRSHGTDMPEDMTTPILIVDPKFDVDLTESSIKDIAPTITSLLGVEADEDWEGKILIKN